jgi:hypothetical protein
MQPGEFVMEMIIGAFAHPEHSTAPCLLSDIFPSLITGGKSTA